ncbi:Stk1 family PASTA domain-containing Ser/Thr kinase [Corynebacterium choanae]|uniref:non-specific serine/threonine protein kinase n=1 Tax=Corynebacterium choanae TaxID=1862358 RepID=A0A3G6J377_9CORY|nr:Stk1 family PASTA domain-containing Ser/Thr kinase [Corynebacterium choanae]AZA12467.1 Serine/threonine-protein kinase PknB [Corynebacterium choanae]
MTADLLADRYELGTIIGTGGMSDVYATTDTLLGREVAVKMMRANLAHDTTFRERFRREAQNAARLNHGAIVQVYDTGETVIGGVTVPYIVMERVHGRTLREIVRQDGPLSPPEAARILLPVCEALQHSHEAGIIHRDVKPANIMITNTGAVKIMDFGIARAIGDAATSMTQTSAVIGTAQYLSPEQARGKSADARSDVYALGCVLYETVTAKPPFEGESPFAVAFQHVQDNPPAPSTLIAGLTPTEAVNIDAVVLTAMAKNPADRYQSAREFAQDLELVSRNAVSHAAKSHLVTPPTESLADGEQTTVIPAYKDDQHGEPVAPVAPAPVAATAPPVSPTPPPPAKAQPAPSPEHAANNQDSQQRSRPIAWMIVAAVLGVAVIATGAVFVWDYLAKEDQISQPSTVAVPQLTNSSEMEATAQLEALGLKIETQLAANPEIPKGYVIDTNPGPGSKLQRGSTVTLNVSSGQEETEVPNLTDRTTKQATELLEAVGLKLDTQVKEESDDEIEEGRIITQQPRPGDMAPKGSKVTITVSKGKKAERVPVITGQQWSLAQTNLTAAGFTPEVRFVDAPQPEGVVVSCANEGQEIPHGSTVVVEVSRGNMITMPDLTGLNPGQAQQALRAAGWTAPPTSLTETPVKTGSLVDSGLVQGQTPAPGDKLLADALVNIQVANFDPLAGLIN